MRAVSYMCLAVVVAACGDNLAYPSGVLFEGTQCCGGLVVGDGYAVFPFGFGDGLIRVPVGGGGPALFVDAGSASLFIITALTTRGDDVLGCAVDDSQNTIFFSVPFAGGAVTLLPEQTVYTGGTINPGRIASDGAGIYGVWLGLPTSQQQGPFTRIADAGDWAFGDVAIRSGVFFVVAPYVPADGSPSGAQVVVVSGGAATRLAVLPGMAFGAIAVDDAAIYVGGASGVARIARADGGVEALGTTPVLDVIDVAGIAYTLDRTPSIVRYDAGGPTTLLRLETVTLGRLASDGQRLYYAISNASGGVIGEQAL